MPNFSYRRFWLQGKLDSIPEEPGLNFAMLSQHPQLSNDNDKEPGDPFKPGMLGQVFYPLSLVSLRSA